MKTGRRFALGAALVLGVLVASPADAGEKNREEVVIRIEVDDDEVSVIRDGVPVPPGSIVAEDGQLVILGDDGETVLLALPHGPHRGLREHLHHLQALPAARGLRIGVWLEPVDPALAAHTGIDSDHAILVTNVNDGGPADRAGMRRYDIVTRVAGEKVDEIGDVRHALEEMEEGDHLVLTVRRGGQTTELDIVPELRDLGPAYLSTDLEDLEDLELEEMLEVMPMLESLDRTVYFATGEDGDFAVVGPEFEREMERVQEEVLRAQEEALRAQEEALRAREEALREVEERLRAIERRLERMEDGE
jgi:hypothetical protein